MQSPLPKRIAEDKVAGSELSRAAAMLIRWLPMIDKKNLGKRFRENRRESIWEIEFESIAGDEFREATSMKSRRVIEESDFERIAESRRNFRSRDCAFHSVNHEK